MNKLVIVESPTKADTINSYLGSGYKVVASKGHIRDLPKSTLGIDVEHGFQPKYLTIHGKGDLLNSLKRDAKAADAVYLATDPDREGEAISWHLATVLGIEPEKACRVTFNEITKKTVTEQMKHPRPIDMNLVNSQQTRRILDRLVGYKISPYLWKTIKSGLSAGRVQTVAARILVEREEEIEAFVPREYWTIEADFSDGKTAFSGKYYGEDDGRQELTCEQDAAAVLERIKDKRFTVRSVKYADKQKLPPPPFTTSSLQQEASRRLGFHSQRTMKVAQELYEGVSFGGKRGAHGLITYMRTDSLRISDEASSAAEKYIRSTYGDEYYPDQRRVYKSSGAAQDAHEAIRPTDVAASPDSVREFLSAEQFKLYKLIFDRFTASQMASAVYKTMNAELECDGCVFRTSGYTVAFKGYQTIYDDNEENGKSSRLPELSAGDGVRTVDVRSERKFTEPPQRFTESTLIRFLEERGIGRPSTYASTITTVLQREYAVREKKSLKATELGKSMVALMNDNFPKIVDYDFTANMEEQLDEIAAGRENMLDVLDSFYDDFKETLASAKLNIKEKVQQPVEESDFICEKCGRRMVIRTGRFGKFAACPGFPQCRNTRPLEEKPKTESAALEKTGEKCPLCGGDMVLRESKYGKYVACENYPNCRNTHSIVTYSDAKCPKCGKRLAELATKRGIKYFKCEDDACGFMSWDKPTGEVCPKCGGYLLEKKSGTTYCMNENCEDGRKKRRPVKKSKKSAKGKR